jgi:hypothetical protein
MHKAHKFFETIWIGVRKFDENWLTVAEWPIAVPDLVVNYSKESLAAR